MLFVCRIKAENQVLRIQGQQPSQERAVSRPQSLPAVPWNNRSFTNGAEPMRTLSGGVMTPPSSTPSVIPGRTGATRKPTYFDRDRTVSGVISPIRGDILPSYSEVFLRSPTSTERGNDDNWWNNSLSEWAQRKRLRQEENDSNKENRDPTKEDDNHKAAVAVAIAIRGEDVMELTGPSVIEQTAEAGNEIKNEEESEPEEEEVDEPEEAVEIDSRLRSGRRKQPNPKRYSKKK